MRYDNHRSWRSRDPERKRFDREDGSHRRYRHGGSRGGYGGRGEGKRFFERGKFKFALLELLALEPMHGYQLIKAMEEKTGGLYSPSPGSVYPNLQMLEDMELIGSSDKDGKKLYHITAEGLASLREKGGGDTERLENRMEHHGRHRHRGSGNGKHHLRALMKDWSEAVHLMARASEAVKEHPSSPQAVQLEELMASFQESLKQLLSSLPHSEPNEPVSPLSEAESVTDDQQADES